MSIFRPLNGARIELADGSEVDVSAIWDIHILVLEHNDCAFLRLSDAHAEDKLAFLYSNAIEAGRGFELTTNEPAAGSDWQPLQPSHFQFGVSADCLRLSSHRITDQAGLVVILGRLIRDMANMGGFPLPVLARDSQGRLQAYVPGSRRSITPVRTIDTPTANNGPNGMGTIQQGMQALASKVHAAAAASGANPGAFPAPLAAGLQQMSAGLKGTTIPGSTPAGTTPSSPAPKPKRRPKGQGAPAPVGPVASPFKSPTAASPNTGGFKTGGLNKSPLKSWF